MSEHAAARPRLTQAARPPRILVENSEYWLRNNGDLAMLAVTLDRMHQRFRRPTESARRHIGKLMRGRRRHSEHSHAGQPTKSRQESATGGSPNPTSREAIRGTGRNRPMRSSRG